MKRLTFCMFLVLLTTSIKSSAQDTTRTLFKLMKPQSLGLYVEPEISYGQLRGSMTGFGGLQRCSY